jgi:hypothetical protein
MTHRERQFQKRRDAIFDGRPTPPPAPVQEKVFGPLPAAKVDEQLLKIDAIARAQGYDPSTRRFKYTPEVPAGQVNWSNSFTFTTRAVPPRVTVTYTKGVKRKKSKPLTKYGKTQVDIYREFPYS